MFNFFKKVKNYKSYQITYLDGDQIFTEAADTFSFSNFMMSLDCAGCVVLDIKEI